MDIVIKAAAAATCIIAAVSDLRTRRIPNVLSATIAVLGILRLDMAQDFLVQAYTLAVAGLAFAVTLALFRCGVMGGGDGKMITATILVIGYQQVLGFLFLMSLTGGTLALAAIAKAKLESILSWRGEITRRGVIQHDRRQGRKPRLTVPYGVAVAGAGIVSLIIAR